MSSARDPNARLLPTLMLTMLAAGTGCAPACLAQQASASDAASNPPVASPLAQKRPVEMAPSAPQVTCRGKEMTIHAENATMGSVLFAIGNCIGLRIEVPEGTSNERAYVQLGPGPTLEVLQSLLGSTEYNYVIEPSSSDPEKIQSVLLMARTKDEKQPGPGSELAMTPARRAWLEMRKHQRPADAAADDAGAAPAESASPSASEAAAAAPVREPDAPGQAQTPAAGASGSEALSAATPPITPSGAASGTTGATASADQPSAAVQAAPGAGLEATPPAAPQAAPAAIAAGGSSPASSPAVQSNAEVSPAGATREMQERISNMQQLFEQRRQMNQQANQSPQ
jgi:hypothetical protein